MLGNNITLSTNHDPKENLAERLSQATLFQLLSSSRLQQLAELCDVKKFKPGTTVIKHLDIERDVYVLLDGSANILNHSSSGRVISYANIESGDYFGEIAAIDEQPCSATVVTKSESIIAVFSGDAFVDLILYENKFAFHLLRHFAGIIKAGHERLSDLGRLSVEQRVCLRLLELARRDPAVPEMFTLYPAPTQASIATSIGASREMVARIFGRLSKEGIIQRKSRTLYIRDKSKLESKTMNPQKKYENQHAL